jgi:broad specificity phosphatase PhoE
MHWTVMGSAVLVRQFKPLQKRRASLMRRLSALVGFGAFLFLAPLDAGAADLGTLVPQLKQGGYVLVIRHGATDDSQKDVYPFVFDDMTKQRQLSEQGRQMARDIGGALKALGIPLGQIYTSQLHRAAETGSLISGAQSIAKSELTDSGAGSATAMAKPTGANAKVGEAIRNLVNAAPKPAANNVLVTHKTNIADAFGKEFGNVAEGEAIVLKPNPSGPPTLVDRVQAKEWIEQAAGRPRS